MQMVTMSEKRSKGTAQHFVEDLNGIKLEMVLIPESKDGFKMGAPEGELKSQDNERPQHIVTVSQFYMGRYPVTQAQWRAVAAMPPVNRELKPDPSSFKGDNRPVEQVNWYEAVEFCARLNDFVEARLSRHTKKNYRLPSEAEWEYACRAGTTTPFHFGETISPKYANYDGRTVYGDNGFAGEYREQTTPVGSLGVANRFGLSDMHGNVWEWCADHWHENYEGAPKDGSAWVTGGNSARRVLRGGSWLHLPEDCRSGYRNYYVPDYVSSLIGFRVVSSASRTS
jgi:formylglycine-generating enzyme required for sulfatase activity